MAMGPSKTEACAKDRVGKGRRQFNVAEMIKEGHVSHVRS